MDCIVLFCLKRCSYPTEPPEDAAARHHQLQKARGNQTASSKKKKSCLNKQQNLNKKNMEAENNSNDAMSDTDISESVSFSQVSAVVTGWTLDFMFVSLLRRFKEGKLDAFNETLSTLEGKIRS